MKMSKTVYRVISYSLIFIVFLLITISALVSLQENFSVLLLRPDFVAIQLIVSVLFSLFLITILWLVSRFNMKEKSVFISFRFKNVLKMLTYLVIFCIILIMANQFILSSTIIFSLDTMSGYFSYLFEVYITSLIGAAVIIAFFMATSIQIKKKDKNEV